MEQGSLLGGARRLATSSTALLAILAIIGVIVMNVTGRIDGTSALDFIKWLVIAYFAKVAVEDGAAKFSGKGGAPVEPEPAKESDDEKDEKEED